jgi:hypothetical protein
LATAIKIVVPSNKCKNQFCESRTALSIKICTCKSVQKNLHIPKTVNSKICQFVSKIKNLIRVLIAAIILIC